MRHKSLTCFVLGDEPLAIHCVQELLTRGHKVQGIVTQTDVVLRWAHDHKIPVIPRQDYAQLLNEQAVDLLLAIAYSDPVSKKTIEQALVASICYHDGHFPRRADMHSTAWSLVNGERQHEIIWQVMTGDAGQGAVLERRFLEIGPQETSVSLNMRNSAMALESFQALLVRLEQSGLVVEPLAPALDDSIVSRDTRPAALAVIDWASSASAIDALIRACDFGQYPNPFAVAKLLHNGCALIVQAAELDESVTNALKPGQIISVDDEAIFVACGLGALRLKRLTTLTGDSLTPQQAMQMLGIVVGGILDSSEAQGAELLTSMSTSLAKSEAHWLRALMQREAPGLPLDTGAQDEAQNVVLECGPAFQSAFEGHTTEAIASVFAFTLSCLMQQDRFDLAFADASGHLDKVCMACSPLLLPMLPLTVDIDATRGFDALVQSLAQGIAEQKDVAVLTDLVARHPALRAQADLRSCCVSEIAVLVKGEEATNAQPLPNGVRLALEIQPGRYVLRSAKGVSASTVQSLARYMSVVAQKVAQQVSAPLSQLDVLDDATRTQQVHAWNATTRPFPDHLRIHELFEAQVALRPDAIALVSQGQTMSFAELEHKANQVAHVLQGRGIGPGQYVAVLVERGFELIAALIGVAKSGAAYLPIDPSYPTDRVHFVLGDAQCAAAIVSHEFADRCNIGSERLLIAGGDVFREASGTRPSCASLPTDVCYTIYTSGSTGNPKGVVLTHRAVVNTLDWVNRNFGVGPSDRLLFVTSPSFDLSVYDIFGALGAGASVDIASSALLREPADLTQYVASAGITIWDSAPPALARLASFFPESFTNSSLRLVMLSGDWIPVWLPEKLMSVFPGVKVKSLGGATEAAIWSNYYPVEKVDPSWTSIPYGYPIQNARYYILDKHLRPVPATIPGDLYIAGDCLAQGYLNREELTQERFINDPFHANQRMYKTGDLARFWADGTMEFLGRSDFQVKIRGYRVEIGEVESAIRALPGVRDAICTTWVDGADQKSLVAYLLATDGAELVAATIKSSLAEKLPDYMVPSYVMVLNAFPLSANGKLERKALPSPSDVTNAHTYRAPSTAVETALAGIWQDVLKRQQVGVTDNFFDIGGHSLLAVVLMTRIRNQLQLVAPLSKLIECPTIEQLAHYLETANEGAMTPSHGLMELRKGGCQNFFLVHDGDGEVLLYRTLSQHLPAQFSVFGVPPRSLPRIPMADRTLEQMAASYLEEVRKRQPQGPYYLGGLCAGGVIAFEMAVQLERVGEKVGVVTIMDAVEPLTKPRAFLTAKRRWHRLASVFSNVSEDGQPKAQALPLLNALGVAVHKVFNVLRYETGASIKKAFSKVRLRLLDVVLERGWTWPAFVPSLTPREIYVGAIGKYHPGELRHAPVVVMKASEGADADEPLIYQIEDPLLGWGRVSRGELEVMDVQGGHSSMLQVPHVQALARQFAGVLPK